MDCFTNKNIYYSNVKVVCNFEPKPKFCRSQVQQSFIKQLVPQDTQNPNNFVTQQEHEGLIILHFNQKTKNLFHIF